MRITFLGTGSIIATPKKKGGLFHSYSGIFVETKESSLLFDIGPGALTKMLQLGIDLNMHPDHLFISHYHIDHVSDLPALIKARGAIMNNEKSVKIINIYGPNHLKDFCKDLFERVKQWKYIAESLNAFKIMKLTEKMEGMMVKTKYWRVSCIPVRHYNGIAYLLESEGKKILYSGDTTYDEKLITLGKNADIAILECSFPDAKSLSGLHLYPKTIAQIAVKGGFKKIILTHFYPQCEGKEKNIISFIENNSPAKVTISYDGMKLKL